MGIQVDRACRIAAGHVCLGVFHTLTSCVAHPLRMISSHDVPSTSLVNGLTPKERELVRSLATQAHEMSETLRVLGWRLLDQESRRRRLK